MKHRHKNKTLSRNKEARVALYRNLIKSLFDHGEIKTTSAKAKAIRPIVERLITHAKKENLASARLVYSALSDRKIGKKAVKDIAPALKDRQGGYLRIIKIGPRRSDDTQMVKVELITDANEAK